MPILRETLKGMGKRKGLSVLTAIWQGTLLKNATNYKPKGKPIANANQASFNSGDGTLITGNQCPISKAQCERLLAFLNSGTTRTGTALSDTHHVANASISCMATSVGGVSGEGSGLVGSSSQSQVNTYLAFNPALMSDNHSNHFFSPSF